jgi:nicotinate phosphoribosyltransferase
VIPVGGYGPALNGLPCFLHPVSLLMSPHPLSCSALLTDLYQLTMLQAYGDWGMNEMAVFEFFVRRLPPGYGFLMAAGLEQVLDYLETLRFRSEELDWLATTGRFREDFLASLGDFRFTGEVHAIAEGTVVFADEPLIQVVAPLREAQLVETRLINLLHYSTLIASTAARVRLAAPEQTLVDFGLRRAHGAEAGLMAARSCVLAGFDGTSNVQAGQLWGLKLYGTMAHAFIQAHESELEAFAHFARSFPRGTTLLIDTYDTESAARSLLPLLRTLGEEGISISLVRIDSGDLAAHAKAVRAILDGGGASEVGIFASGNLDAARVAALVRQGTPINGFGVGTKLVTAADQPYLDCAYKLQEYGGQPRRKRSEGKATWPGRKQVWRQRQDDGRLRGDLLALASEHATGEALLQPVMREGRRLAPSPPLAELCARAARELTNLPEPLRELEGLREPPDPVVVSSELRALAATLDQRSPEP